MQAPLLLALYDLPGNGQVSEKESPDTKVYRVSGSSEK